jgi:hypothetical protein
MFDGAHFNAVFGLLPVAEQRLFRWTVEDGLSDKAIGLRLGVTESKARALAMRVVNKVTDAIHAQHAARRTCLMCGRTFDSEGPWNRRCKTCKHSLAWHAESRAPQAPAMRAGGGLHCGVKLAADDREAVLNRIWDIEPVEREIPVTTEAVA